MDFLRSFIIGTSGLVWFPHWSALALTEKDKDYPFERYSIIMPVYYGLMAVFATYLGKVYGWSLEKRLFITSVVSVSLMMLFMLVDYYSSIKDKPNRSKTSDEWLTSVLRDGVSHLLAFNVTIFLIETYFPTVQSLKVFVIGSSIFSYLLAFLKVQQHVKKKGRVNYDYRVFAVTEPFVHGFGLLLSLFVLNSLLGMGLVTSLLIMTLVGDIIWLYLAYNTGIYTYDTKGWIQAFIVMLLSGVKLIPIYYLLKHL